MPEEFRAETRLWIGSEHYVELDELEKQFGKITIPPAFGLVPAVLKFKNVNLRDDPAIPEFREAIEFVSATPLEYLDRWIANNEIFGDDVRLISVIKWANGEISFGITQPQYHGEPAEPREIERHFLAAGWVRLKDPSGHVIFFHPEFEVIAIDAERRNCYLKDDNLLPFDVILCKPDPDLARFLRI